MVIQREIYTCDIHCDCHSVRSFSHISLLFLLNLLGRNLFDFFKTRVFLEYFDLLLFVFKHDCRLRSSLIGWLKAVQRGMASISRNEQGDYLILIMSSVPK